MDKFLIISTLLSICVFAKGDLTDTDPTDSPFSDATVGGTSIGSIILVIIIGCLIYHCCCRNKVPEGFTTLDNEDNNARPQRRWRNKRFFRRNRRENVSQNNPNATQPTQVIIQPVINMNMPPGDQRNDLPAGQDVHGMPSAPPPYDNIINPPAAPGYFNHPPTVPGNFTHPPPPPPMPGNFTHPPPVPGNFTHPPPMPGNFNHPSPMPGNFNVPPMKNPNASSHQPKI